MQSRVDQACQFIKYSITATNTPDIKKGDTSDKIVIFYRAIINKISTNPILLGRLMKDSSEHLIPIVDELATAVLALAYKKGRCGEYASISFIELLKKGIHKSIEIIATTGVLFDGTHGTHQNVILDRDAKQSLEDTKSISNITVFDCWWKYLPKTFSGTVHPTKANLTSNYIVKVEEIKVSTRYEKNLTSDDCKEIVKFLLNLRNIIDHKLFADVAASSDRTDIDIEYEIEEIRKIISNEIKCFKLLAISPPTDPHTKPANTPTLFKPIIIHSIKKTIMIPPRVKFHYYKRA